MVDHLSGGRVELARRSAPYEQTGMALTRDTRDMWEESLAMIPKAWEEGMFEWEGVLEGASAGRAP
jgi:alkanesulfonate monooxygenase SsuD/methylene tetrahydromethanopterin reductase-like flavin-dependent oxidoreductase (luciferase family)